MFDNSWDWHGGIHKSIKYIWYMVNGPRCKTTELKQSILPFKCGAGNNKIAIHSIWKSNWNDENENKYMNPKQIEINTICVVRFFYFHSFHSMAAMLFCVSASMWYILYSSINWRWKKQTNWKNYSKNIWKFK